jgi:hypothetical protein
MKNATVKLAATATLAILLGTGFGLQLNASALPVCSHPDPPIPPVTPTAAAPVAPKIDPNISGLAGAVLQQTLQDFNRCNPSSSQYQGFPCAGPAPLPNGEINFMNSNGEYITPQQFMQQNNQVPQASGVFVNPDGTIELR